MLGWKSTFVTTRIASEHIVENTKFYQFNHRHWRNPGDISLHYSYAKQFSSPILEPLPRVESTPNTIKTYNLLHRIAQGFHKKLTLKFSDISLILMLLKYHLLGMNLFQFHQFYYLQCFLSLLYFKKKHCPCATFGE